MEYNISYFIDFFEKKKKWKNGEIGSGGKTAPHCALGHMGFITEDLADNNKRAKALCSIITKEIEALEGKKVDSSINRPSCVIPMLNDGSRLLLSTDEIDTKKYGIRPKQRIMKVLKSAYKRCIAEHNKKPENPVNVNVINGTKQKKRE